ncbi:hypothetical protein RIF29_19580 [Crotalaria pallida]|uniref:PWWP domain-containing protein n=1 Tax=Crotalaria pallida TaxID=3830 RepID=A0AAN9I6M6_CROPI
MVFKVEMEEVEFIGNEKVLKQNVERRKDGLFGPEDFYAGDIVWAKARKREPFWPAIVIDPMTQAPELVLRSCVPDATSVMFLGFLGSRNQRDYGWVKDGMIFPFMDFVDWFQGQSELSYYNSSNFQVAIEEAFLADQGHTEKLIADINTAVANTDIDNTVLKVLQEDTGPNQYSRYHFLNQLKSVMLGIFCILKNLEGTDYFCPTCKAKFDFELSVSEKLQPKAK